MADFNTLLSAADDIVFDLFGVSATYTDNALNETSCKVIVEEGIDLIDHNYGQVVGKTTAISLLRSDIDDPERGDTIETLDDGGNVDSTYTVEEELSRDKFTVMVSVKHGG